MKTLLTVLGIVVLLALVAGTASAAYVAIIEPTEDPPTVTWYDFECGLQYTVGMESAHVEGCWFTQSPVGYAGSATAFMVEEPFDANPGAISDWIHITFEVIPGPVGNEAHIIIDFQSDVAGTPKQYPPAGWPLVVVEDGGIQPLTNFFVDPATLQPVLPPQGIEIWAASDFGHPVPVVPSTWAKVKATYR